MDCTYENDSLPYNPKNSVLDEKKLEAFLNLHGVDKRFNDINVYRMACVHKSYCTRRNENFINGNINCPEGCLGLQECSNERLEFLGDSVLSLVVAEYLYERFPDSEEGFLTKMRTKLVNGQMLADLAKKIGLGAFVIISKQIDDNGGRANAKLLEDTFEAFIGAMFLDFGQFGLEMARNFIITIVESNIDFASLVASNTNYKDAFLKYYQHNHNSMPKFYELNVTSRHGDKEYNVCIKSKDGIVISSGKGPNKKMAESNAAYNALKYFGQL
jgi:ribonuclease-3